MQTDTWANLIGRIQALSGVETLLTAEATLLASIINRRAFQAYRYSDSWSRYLTAGQARPGPTGIIPYSYTNATGNRTVGTATSDGYVVTITTTVDIDGDFVTGQYVTIASMTYVTVNPNGAFKVTVTGDDTFTYKLADTSLTSTETYVSSPAATTAPVVISDVDTFIRVHAAQPFNLNSALELDFYAESDGAHVIGNSTSLIGFWVTYKKVWAGPYDSVTNTAIPLEWFEFIAHASYADYLRMDKQNQTAVMEERVAMNFLGMELMKPQNQFNNQITSRMSTHLSRQSR